MTLRQRWNLWRERDRVVRRTDLSVAEKVAVLQGNMLEPFIRRTQRAADSMSDLGASVAKTTAAVRRINSVFDDVASEPSIITDDAMRRLKDFMVGRVDPNQVIVSGTHSFEGDIYNAIRGDLRPTIEVIGTDHDGTYEVLSIELKPDEHGMPNRTEMTLKPIKKDSDTVRVAAVGPTKVECECGRAHLIYPTFVKPEHITADGRLRRTPDCDNREE